MALLAEVCGRVVGLGRGSEPEKTRNSLFGDDDRCMPRMWGRGKHTYYLLPTSKKVWMKLVTKQKYLKSSIK